MRTKFSLRRGKCNILVKKIIKIKLMIKWFNYIRENVNNVKINKIGEYSTKVLERKA